MTFITQGTTHRLCSAMKPPTKNTEAAAWRRKAGAAKMPATTRSAAASEASPATAGAAGSARSTSTAATRHTAAMIQNAPRQPSTGSTASSGTLAVSAPSEPEAMMKPIIELWRSGGYHNAKPFKAAIRQADTPTPTRARAPASAPSESAIAKSALPSAASSSSAASTRRGPKRSSAIPTGICAAPKARKYALVNNPRLAADRPSSSVSRGEITALTVRSR